MVFYYYHLPHNSSFPNKWIFLFKKINKRIQFFFFSSFGLLNLCSQRLCGNDAQDADCEQPCPEGTHLAVFCGETLLNSLSQLGHDSRGAATEKHWQREMPALLEATRASAALVCLSTEGRVEICVSLLDQGAEWSSLHAWFRSSVSGGVSKQPFLRNWAQG